LPGKGFWGKIICSEDVFSSKGPYTGSSDQVKFCHLCAGARNHHRQVVEQLKPFGSRFMSGSRLGVTAHDVFMTLPPYAEKGGFFSLGKIHQATNC